jgi:large subunit ribosomal protein L21
MYAIIRTGGKQAKVREGDIIEVERLKDASDTVSFVPLLVVDANGKAVSDRGALAAASVTAEVLGESKGEKVDIFKYKNKSGYSRRMGHRQVHTRLRITGIAVGKPKSTRKKAAAPAAAEPAEPAEAEE